MTSDLSSDHSPVSRSLLVALAAAAVVLFGIGFLRARPDTIDDAHITFRYIDNLLAGHGLSFNPGEIVEGYSNPLFLFLLVPFRAAGLPLEGTAAAIGLLSFLFCILAASRLTALAGGGRWQCSLAAILTLAQFPLLYYSITGLETGFFAALIAAGLWRYLASGRRVDGVGAVLWTAVALCRPEGILYPVSLGAYEVVKWVLERPRAEGRRRSILWLVGVACGFGVFLLWRRWYFGRWLPNTFTAKPPGTAALQPSDAGLGASLEYVLGFVWQMGIALPLAALWTLRRGRRLIVGPYWIVVGVGLFFGLYTGGDWMPASRYLLPVFVPLLVLGLLGLGDLAERMREIRPSSILPRTLVLVAAGAAILVPGFILYTFFALRDTNPYHIMNSETCKEAALEMRKEFGADKTIVAHRIGALGRFSHMTVIDLFGLVDPKIAAIVARHPRYHPIPHRGNDIPELRRYIASRKPDLVLTINYGVSYPRTLDLYGYHFVHRHTYRLGADERWELYEREP